MKLVEFARESAKPTVKLTVSAVKVPVQSMLLKSRNVTVPDVEAELDSAITELMEATR